MLEIQENIHDNTIVSYFVDFENEQIIFNTVYLLVLIHHMVYVDGY